MEQLINPELCAKCGGKCCKAGGCRYFVTDFENMKLEYLESVLNSGRISIKAQLTFNRLSNGLITYTPTLYLKARNINRDEIDLVSFQTTCASLEENGCHFSLEERPSGGVQHVPKENLECYSIFTAKDEVDKYLPYQKVLQRIVKRRTGMSVDAKIKEDIENLFLLLLTKNFEGIDPIERGAFNGVMGILIECFLEQYKNAIIKIHQGDVVLRK